jgi:hypothetical protein
MLGRPKPHCVFAEGLAAGFFAAEFFAAISCFGLRNPRPACATSAARTSQIRNELVRMLCEHPRLVLTRMKRALQRDGLYHPAAGCNCSLPLERDSFPRTVVSETAVAT